MKRLLILIILLWPVRSWGGYLIYNEAGNIGAIKDDAYCNPGQTAMEYNGEWNDNYFQSMLVKDGVLVDNPDYNRHIEISGDAQMPAGSDTQTLTITLKDRYDNVIDTDIALDISTTRGRLSTRSVTITQGTADFSFRAVDETIDITITVTDASGVFRPASFTITLIP